MPGPYTDITTMTEAEALSHLGGYNKVDTLPVSNVDTEISAEETNKQIGGLVNLVTAVNGRTDFRLVDVTAPTYGAVADGSSTDYSTTDNYQAFVDAIDFCRDNPGYALFVPPGEYDVYFNTDIFDTTAGKQRYLAIDFANMAIFGAGIGRTIIRGKSSHVLRGRVASLVGNTLTFQTASDAGAIRANWSFHITEFADGTGERTIAPGSISVLGPVCSSAAGNGTLGTVALYEGSRIQGVTTGDYIFCDVGFALFQHEYSATSLTEPWNLTLQNLELHAETSSAVVDPTGDANPILDCPIYCLNSNPQPMTAGTSPYHRVVLDHVRCEGGYTQLHFGAGGANTLATTELALSWCDAGTNAMMAVFMSTNDTFADRTYTADHCYFHGLEATMASHLNYINPAVSLKITNCHYDGWRSSNFALQHWGSVSVANKFAIFSNCYFGSLGTGAAVLTGEHGSVLFDACVFECYNGVQVRCSANFDSCLFKPATPSGTGIQTYLDCQYFAQINIKNCGWNLVDIVDTGYTACVLVDTPVQMMIEGCWATSIDAQQDSSNTLVRGNTGPFLSIATGSTGGLVTVKGLRGRFSTASGAPTNVGWLASLTGTTGAAVKFVDVVYASRPATDRGMIQCQNRTSSDRIEVVDCDFTVGTNSSKAIYTTSSLPANVISGRNNRFNGAGSTFVAAQRLRTREETGPDIASGATITWDPDYDYARITGTTTISTMNITGTSQLGYDGCLAVMIAPSGWATDALGNFAAAYTVAAGAALVVRYDASATKWIRVGS